MKAGRVVTVRINPADCMSVIDIAEKIGMRVRGVSFSQLVSVAVSSALESFRQNGIVPQRSGFEYSSMMAEFPVPRKEARSLALDVTKTFQMIGSTGQIPAVVANPELDRKKGRFEELVGKYTVDESSISKEEQDEMSALALELNPE